MTVIDFNQFREKRTPHTSGDARCLQCGHEWAAIAPVGAVWLECPQCHVERACFTGPCYPKDGLIWVCNCGNELFLITPDGELCPVCGCYTDHD